VNKFIVAMQRKLSEDLTATVLKALIILWSLFIIVLALVTESRWVLAGILAYEVLP